MSIVTVIDNTGIEHSRCNALINWISVNKSCVEPYELKCKDLYTDNYIDYINNTGMEWFNIHGGELHSVVYTHRSMARYNKLILNAKLYSHQWEQINEHRLNSTLDNIIGVLTKHNITSVAIPLFNSYGPLTEQMIIDCILNKFSMIPNMSISLYKRPNECRKQSA